LRVSHNKRNREEESRVSLKRPRFQ
jgi:hypothetical protein